ncbi:MAG: hypothetical protein HZA32_12995 [Opitutae bacterium]|nr:hypothetical protein [Opitutae bacterium]
MTTSPSQSPTASGLPLVVQVAFAGKRRLFDPPHASSGDEAAFAAAVERLLVERLHRLQTELGGGRVCGLSSLAAGGDLMFARSCQQLGWWQRVLLPQPREDFLAACGSGGPDFTPAEAEEARRLLLGGHVIEERVASVASERATRFEDVNLELVRICDVLVCLLPGAATADKPAGTRATLALAQRWHRPVLEIGVTVGKDGKPVLSEQWHCPPSKTAGACPAAPGFAPARLPAPLDRITPPATGLDDAAAYRAALKQFSSATATRMQRRFKWAALIIVGAHVAATALALAALKIHGETALHWLLGIELSFLLFGLGYHEYLHRSHAAQRWAMARLSAEVARSAIPLAGVPRSLRYLFELPMPGELRPLLRTLNVLHLAGLSARTGTWQARRETYVAERLRKPVNGQLDYYARRLAQARRWLQVAQATFFVGSAGAFAATAAKLGLALDWWHVGTAAHDLAAGGLGSLAVFLPVVAVAALSLAGAFDLEARVHTYAEMLEFLQHHTHLIEAAVSENEFATLALQIEARLLGETANWHARRAFTGVA